jgi:hypothetical protein
MAASCIPAVAVMLLLAGTGAPPPAAALAGVWAGLSTVMLLRWLLIWLPYQAGAGPFAQMFPEKAARGGR